MWQRNTWGVLWQATDGGLGFPQENKEYEVL